MRRLSVDAEAVRRNIHLVRERAGSAAIYGVVKGDGYGLGVTALAGALKSEGISRFAVGDLWEAAALRNAGFSQEEILLLRSTCDEKELETAIDLSVVATVGSTDAAVALSGIAERRGTVAEAHIEIDTGMGRYGFLPSETDKILSVIRYLPGVAVCGVYTHFYAAFRDRRATVRQAVLFDKTLSELRAAGLETGTVHAANSSALFRHPDLRYDAVRVGSAFTGRLPGRDQFGLQRAAALECSVSEVRWLPKGHPIGYGAGFVTKRPTRIAVLPAGWIDGISAGKSRDIYSLKRLFPYAAAEAWRCLQGRRLTVRFGGTAARVLGSVGMQHTVVDVTEFNVKPGDTAVVEVSPSFFRGGGPIVWAKNGS